MRKRNLIFLSLISMSALILIAVVWFGLKFLCHYETVLHRVTIIEKTLLFSGRSWVGASLRHQHTSPAVKYLEPEAKHTLSLNGSWKQIGGDQSNGGWDAEFFQKTKALEVHADKLCTGLMGTKPDGADVWCLDGDKWSQIGGDGLRGSWSGGLYVTFLYSHRAALYAGVDSEIWRFKNNKWEKIAKLEMPGKTCLAYSAAAISDTVYFGSLNCGLQLHQLDSTGLSQTPLGLAPEILSQYLGIYELQAWRNELVIGAAASDYGTGGVFTYRPKLGTLKIGGDGVNGSWINTGFAWPESFTIHRGNLIVSFGKTPVVNEVISPVWSFDGTRWAPLGLDMMPGLWRKMVDFNAVKSINGTLLVAGGGLPGGLASIWHMDSEGRFQQLGGHGIAKSWGAKNGEMLGRTSYDQSGAEYIYQIEKWHDRIVVGFGDGPGMAQIWLYDPNSSDK